MQDAIVHGWNTNTKKKKVVSGIFKSRGRKQMCDKNVTQKEYIAVRVGELLAGQCGSGTQGAQDEEG